MPLKIVVCVKEIPNPEIASSVFRIDELKMEVAPLAGSRLVMSPFDEQAVELALRIREGLGAGSITLVCLGAETTRSIVKHGLALGADDAVLLIDPAFDHGDSYTTASVLGGGDPTNWAGSTSS